MSRTCSWSARKSAGQDGGGPDRARRVKGEPHLRDARAPAASRISPPSCSRAAPASACTHVTYRGVTPALTDVLRGEVDHDVRAGFDREAADRQRRVARARRREREAQRRASRCADDRRSRRDAGLRGRLLVRADGAGRNAATRSSPSCARASIAAINAPEAKAALEAQGAQPVGNTPAELAAVIAADTARWAKVIRDADIKLGALNRSDAADLSALSQRARRRGAGADRRRDPRRGRGGPRGAGPARDRDRAAHASGARMPACTGISTCCAARSARRSISPASR